MFFSKSTRGFYSTDVHGKNMPADAVEISDALYNSVLSTAFIIDANGLPALPPPPSAADLAATAWVAYQYQAKVALDASDTTVLRCYESGVALPPEWSAYRKALRAILTAPVAATVPALPAKPAYPQGT